MGKIDSRRKVCRHGLAGPSRRAIRFIPDRHREDACRDPLTDGDRQPWLERVAASIDSQRAKKQPGIITCSALKRAYRQFIIGDRPEVRLVYLRGGRDLIAEHVAGRRGHFMPASLLRSQIDTLEEPESKRRSLTIEASAPPDQIAEEIIRRLCAATVIQNTTAFAH